MRKEIETETAGSPVTPGELWTNRSCRDLSKIIEELGFVVSPNTIDRLLREELGLGRRQALKDVAIGSAPDRDAQFQRIAELRRHYHMRDWPIISIDTKKKEMLGNFHRQGVCRTSGRVHTFDHDFPSAGEGKVIPYGVYDVRTNAALMTLARGSDTGELVGDSIRMWWNRMGRYRYDGAKQMLILADSGGSNGCRVRLFHEQLWKISEHLGITLRVAHLPSYCSKYNPIDHRLFCHVTRSLKGVVFHSIGAIRNAASRTATSTGLQVKVAILKRIYRRGVQATERFLNGDYIRHDAELPKYNYTTTG
ncbi:ISAzo13 family transposase [Rosistilla oblonga]|uniref:ISAzo13 family transposase n=1 Tax=Rosistilla oblonga TaxID=2527990 RepID=UPI001E5CCE04|nr:ISAzo13 family transposase [Rosistilla oblonga]